MTTQAEHNDAIARLSPTWKAYCDKLFEDWKKRDPPSPPMIWNPTWEVEYNEERRRRWQALCVKEGDKWWGDRGYKLQWPENPNDPLAVILIVDSESNKVGVNS